MLENYEPYRPLTVYGKRMTENVDTADNSSFILQLLANEIEQDKNDTAGEASNPTQIKPWFKSALKLLKTLGKRDR